MASDEEIMVNPRKLKTKNINLEAAYIHVLTDLILSIGVILSALVIFFMSEDHHTWSYWQLADPFCTYFFSVLAIWSTWPILKESVLLLLDASHDKELVQEVSGELKAIKGVNDIQEFKLWSTNRGKHYAAFKVKMGKECQIWQLKKVLNREGIKSYIEVEEEEEQLVEE